MHIVVIGGGLVGLAIALGLLREGAQVTVLDGSDRDFRASKANFGLIALQSKGMGMACYANLSRRSLDLWADFARDIEDISGLPVHYRVRGGYTIALSEAELQERRAFVARLNAQPGIIPVPTVFLNREDLLQINPQIGPNIVGASHCPLDAMVDVLTLFHAMHAALAKQGGNYMPGATVQTYRPTGQGFTLQTQSGKRIAADRIVLAAGLDNQRLAQQAAIDPNIHSAPGTLLVTERTERFLDDVLGSIRQTEQGSVLIGGSPKKSGIDTTARIEDMSVMAARAIRIFPFLARLRIVRAWRGLRIMTRDGFPVYEQSERMPGVFVCACHSGVTLAAFHSVELAPMILRGHLEDPLAPFHSRRFHVLKAA